ncbi:hypothetical protein HJC23_002067 [Cyclotella cryptica]|uniref:E3 ubiquitin ligase UBR4 C-terminal domain-containing protein n=1 Tax=Cyclotella cryptica TaxID=29204 RepID=A0ABD3QBZ7_9STRA|eukprot:CCRYP_008319-RA/>CCRYP_008319-RA protein AED:0.05 eAED:0.05 QI:312/1/1/1/0.85/0.75/8/827/2456
MMDPSIALPLLLGLSRSRTILQRPKNAPETLNLLDPPPAVEEEDDDGRSLSLSKRLHRLLSSQQKQHASIIQWQSHGRSFRIWNVERLIRLLDPNDARTTRHDDHDDNENNTSSIEDEFTQRLLREGFRKQSRGLDAGCFWKEGFTRRGCCCPDAMDDDARENTGMETKTTGKVAAAASPPSSLAGREEIDQFLNFTCVADEDIARRYLEMSHQDVEMAVTLFLEHGGEHAGVDVTTNDDKHGGGEKERGTEDEPDFYSMPPILEEVPPALTPGGIIVSAALREYWAYKTLRRALLRWIQARGQASLPAPTATTITTTTSTTTTLATNKANKRNHPPSQSPTTTNKHHGTSHFLFQSLIHPSISVRRTAGRIVLHNLHKVHHTLTTHGYRNATMELQEALIFLLHRLFFFGEGPYESYQSMHSSSSERHVPTTVFHPSSSSSYDQGDPAVQLMAMLLSLVCEGGYSQVVIADHVRMLARRSAGVGAVDVDKEEGFSSSSSSGILFQSQLQEWTSRSIEAFVASGGLRWACGCIVRLVHMLVHGSTEGDVVVGGTDDEESGSDATGSDDGIHRKLKGWKNRGINNETIQTRLVLLIDLVYRLVLFGSVPSAVEREGALASLVQTPLEGGEDGGSDNGLTPAPKGGMYLTDDDVEKDRKRKRNHTSPFYDVVPRTTTTAAEGGETSRAMALRRSIRSSFASGVSLMAPPLSSGGGRDKDKGNNGGGNNSSGDGGGEKHVSSSVAEENRQRRERRKATLERVHRLFWSTTLPAAVCIGRSSSHWHSDDAVEASCTASEETYQGNFSPLACLIAAYEVLRSPSASRGRFDDATNKAISILSRLVDPAAGQALVASDPEIPWGLAAIFGDWGERGVDNMGGKNGAESLSRKRDRSSSHASQDSLHSKTAPSRPVAAVAASLNDAGRASKRFRSRRARMSSFLERLPHPSRETQDSVGAASPFATSAASGTLYSSARYRSAVESAMLRASAGAAGTSSTASAQRDGSLNRIIAAGEERSGLGESSGAVRARALLDRRSARECIEWSVLNDLPDGEDEDVDGDEVIMMDEDDDTEFEQDHEDEPVDDMDDLPDGPDDPDDGGDDEGDDEDGDDGDENGEDTDEGEDDDLFDDAVIVMDQVTAVSGNDDREHNRNNPHRQQGAKGTARSGGTSLAFKKEHEQAYLRAGMEILSAQYLGGREGNGFSSSSPSTKHVNAFSIFSQPPAFFPSPLLTLSAEQSLLQSMCDIVKPPRKPLNLKIFMRRAPTQEEFFRGALSRNPINLSSLKAGSSGGDDRTNSDEPTFGDLRKYIAKDLQMEDSAELLELLVASKIIDVNIKLRVCQQVLWKKYVLENSTSVSAMISGAGPGHQMINTGSGLSMIFNSTSLAGRPRGSGADELDVSQLPPMVVTYRLAGVDGEATEDKVEAEDLEDPEAPVVTSPRALEQKMEKEFGITRSLASNGGVSIILASVQSFIDEVTTRIRRDEIPLKRRELSITDENLMRAKFAKSPPCPGLILLRHCANLTENRKKLLSARAPTILLRMLLDVLNAMNRSTAPRRRALTFDGASSNSMDVDENPTTRDVTSSSAESNPTTNILQEIIEMLASDISSEVSDDSSDSVLRSHSFVNASQKELGSCGGNDDHDTLPLVLNSLRSANLSPPLRKVISKLLPFLTYGQVDQSKELASFFIRYVKMDSLAASDPDHDSVMMNTFVEAAINLPPVTVCDNLRQALITNGFVNKVKSFVVLQAPHHPPPWSPALYPKSLSLNKPGDNPTTELKEAWRKYFDRPGLAEAIKILIGLSSKHHATQVMLSEELIGDMIDLPTLCHWVESTSDNEPSGIKTNGLGILAETLLDALKEGNDKTSEKIDIIRKKTRDRKREIAEERRNRALVGMSAFGTLAGSAVIDTRSPTNSSNVARETAENRSTSMLASMFGLSAFSTASLLQSSQRTTRAAAKDSVPENKNQPSWMAEMEAMEEESGLTCAVCQEGRTLQPSELLGLYAFMKKVTIPSSQGGGRGDIDGTVMLMSLPLSCPRGIIGSQSESLFQRGKAAANALHGTSQALTAMAAATSSISSTSSSSRTYYITTVSAGNAIHCSCHAKAKAADRSHPKAPKSEWEGASLRNSRVTCNVILPLVSSKTSNVPLIAVENALGEVATIQTTILGVRPKSMLWNVLHDVRLLLLRMAYGEALNADCGGGSSSSNFLLVLYQLYTADMFSRNAELDDSQVAKHARGLSSGFLAAVDIVDAVDFDRNDTRSKRLERGVADAAPMAALCSILFFNSGDDTTAGATFAHDLTDTDRKVPPANRQWELYKTKFLAGLLRCAGHRHSLGVNDSGCITARGISTGSRKNIERARSYMEWSAGDEGATSNVVAKKKTTSGAILEHYAVSLRPMITLYAILNSISKEFVVNDTDENTLEASERLASSLESCHKASCIDDLLDVAENTMDHDVICKYFEKGLFT